MKKTIFILFAVINVNLVSGQCSCCGSSSNISAGEVTPAAYALGKKQLFGELYSDFRFFNKPADHLSIDHQNQTSSALNINSMVITTIGLRYGISSKATLLVQQPYIFINAATSSSKAFGDLLSLINIKVFDKSKFIIGLQAGMEWPTGQYILSGSGNSISTGSGSYDPVAGLNVMKSFKNSAIRASGFFKYTTNGFNNTNYGNFFGHQIGYSYFLFNKPATCTKDSVSKPSKPTLAINAQISGEWSQAQIKENISVPNTGSYLVLAGLGATLGFKGFTIPVSVTVPLYHQYYGDQNQNTLRLRVGLTKIFN